MGERRKKGVFFSKLVLETWKLSDLTFGFFSRLYLQVLAKLVVHTIYFLC